MRRTHILLSAACLLAASSSIAAPLSPAQAKAACLTEGLEPDDTIAACSQLIASGREPDQDLAAAYFQRGQAWSGKGDYAQAVLSYDEAIRRRPSLEALNARAFAWSLQGQKARALADLDAMVQLDPASTEALSRRGEFYQDEGELDRAGSDFGRWLSLAPNDPAAWLARAGLHRARGRLPEAIADLDQSIRLNPSSAALEARSSAYLLTGQLGAATADMDILLRRTRDDPNVLANRCIARWRLGAQTAGLADCAAGQRFLRQFPFPNVRPWTAEAGLRLLASDLNHAQAVLDEAMQRNPQDGAALALRAVLRQRQGDGPAAKASMDAALAQNAAVRESLVLLFGPELLPAGMR